MTRTVVYADPESMIAWARARMPLGGAFRSDARAIGLARDGDLIAVAVFDTFGPRDCVFSVAAEPGRRWLTREFCRHVAAFPFITAGLARLTCLISVDNPASIRFAEHMGLTLEGRLREAGHHGEDWLVYGLLRRECRWLPKSLAPPRQTARGAL